MMQDLLALILILQFCVSIEIFDLRNIELKFNNKTLYYTTYNNRTEKE